jgi:hypothetical protein
MLTETLTNSSLLHDALQNDSVDQKHIACETTHYATTIPSSDKKIRMLWSAFGTKQEQEACFSLDFHQLHFVEDCFVLGHLFK